ncbi:MAG: ABC transporter permease [Candidatus Omnitrophica bacterium]|nr:ABC transporter permease [Candidatus Omnitrophota bacterium]
MFLLKFALLNLTRNKRRSAITVLAVGIGLAALIFLWAFMDGSHEEQRENVTRLFTGHVQIHAAGFAKKMSAELVIPNRPEVLEKIKSNPRVVSLAPRSKCEALIGTTAQSKGIVLTGIDLDAEPLVTDIKKQVKEGEFLSGGEGKEILIGHVLAEKLEVGLGDKVVLMTQAMDGTLAGFAYRVKGVIHSGALPLDEYSAFISLASSQELLGIDSDIHEIAVRLRSRAEIEGFKKDMQTVLPSDSYEMLAWNEIVPEVDQWASYSNAIIQTMLIAVMAVIAVGVMNTILMSIFERTKEIGVMMALGTGPRQVVSMIFFETLVLEFIGIILGIGLAYLLVFHFQRVGILMTGFEDAFAESFMSPVVHPHLAFHRVLTSVKTLVLITSFISLYPAWRAAKMEPVKAIYHS